MAMNNLFNNLRTDDSAEILREIVETDAVRIERIISKGQASPPGFWYDQPRNEWVVVLQGKARLLLEGDDGPLEMGPGDYLDIPAHCRHRVEWTDPERPTIWLAVHYE